MDRGHPPGRSPLTEVLRASTRDRRLTTRASSDRPPRISHQGRGRPGAHGMGRGRGRAALRPPLDGGGHGWRHAVAARSPEARPGAAVSRGGDAARRCARDAAGRASRFGPRPRSASRSRSGTTGAPPSGAASGPPPGSRSSSRGTAASSTCQTAPSGRRIRPTPPGSYRVSFADAFAFLLISEESLAELNRRLETPLPMNRFRPNLVIAGGEPFGEDRLTEFRMGGVRFRVGKAVRSLRGHHHRPGNRRARRRAAPHPRDLSAA